MALCPPLRRLLYVMNLCFQLIIQYSSLLRRPFNLPVGVRTSKTEEEESESPPALSVIGISKTEEEEPESPPALPVIRISETEEEESESPPALSVINDDFIEDEILIRLPIEESESPPALSVINDDFIEDEILIRLPIELIVRFQQVSKHWCSRIRDRFFSKTSGLISLGFCRGYRAECNDYVPLPNGFKNLALLPPASPSSPHENLVFHDSCNGLLLYETLGYLFLELNSTKPSLTIRCFF